jgi:hypothetical protein
LIETNLAVWNKNCFRSFWRYKLAESVHQFGLFACVLKVFKLSLYMFDTIEDLWLQYVNLFLFEQNHLGWWGFRVMWLKLGEHIW